MFTLVEALILDKSCTKPRTITSAADHSKDPDLDGYLEVTNLRMDE